MRLRRCLELGLNWELWHLRKHRRFRSLLVYQSDLTLATINKATASLRKFSEKQDQLSYPGKDWKHRVTKAKQVHAPREVGWERRYYLLGAGEGGSSQSKYTACVVEQSDLGRGNLKSCYLCSPREWRGCGEASWKAAGCCAWLSEGHPLDFTRAEPQDCWFPLRVLLIWACQMVSLDGVALSFSYQ